MSTTTVTVVAVGTTLPNGALVIDVRHDTSQEKFGDMREQGVVLALIGGGEWASEFATWDFYCDPSWGAVTVSGHYYGDLSKALSDLEKRSA